MRNWLILGVAVVVAVLVALVAGPARNVPERAVESASTAAPSPSSRGPVAPPARTPGRTREEFVGSAACAACHRAQSDAYVGSHHERALTAPNPEQAKQRFDGSHFSSKLGGITSFELRNGAPLVTTKVAGGKSATFPISYASGVWPLEQYVVATERGKLQSLGVVWDSRSAAEGGNKWFHVYGGSGIAPSDALFFNSSAQNWNHVCADCHSTWVERRYDATNDSFDTRWAELSVGCEACHGPGVEHVRSAQAGKPTPFAVRLKPSAPWAPSPTGSPSPRDQDGVEVEVCAPCHSRRTP